MSAQEVQGLRRFRPSRRKFVPARASSLAHLRRPEIREEARQRVCLRRSPHPFHPDRQVPSRGACGATHRRSLVVSLSRESDGRVEMQNAHAAYHSRKYKELPRDILLASHRRERYQVIVLELPGLARIFAAASRDTPGKKYSLRPTACVILPAPIVCRSRIDRLSNPRPALPCLDAGQLSSAQLQERGRKVCPPFRS